MPCMHTNRVCSTPQASRLPWVLSRLAKRTGDARFGCANRRLRESTIRPARSEGSDPERNKDARHGRSPVVVPPFLRLRVSTTWSCHDNHRSGP